MYPTNVININIDPLYNCNQPSVVTPVQPTPLYPVLNPTYNLPPKPQLTQAIHNETVKLLDKASEMSESILYGNQPTPPSSHPQYTPVQQPVLTKPTYNFDFSDKSWKMFNKETHVHHHYHDGKESEKKDDTGARILVGLIGLIVAGVTAFFIGKAVAQGEDIEEENVNFEDLKTRWSINKFGYEADYQLVVDGIVRKAEALLQRQQANRTHKIALLVLGLVTGGTAVAGAIVGSSAIMLGAAGLGAVMTVATLFKLGHACFSTRDQKDAKAIEQGLIELSQKTVFIVG